MPIRNDKPSAQTVQARTRSTQTDSVKGAKNAKAVKSTEQNVPKNKDTAQKLQTPQAPATHLATFAQTPHPAAAQNNPVSARIRAMTDTPIQNTTQNTAQNATQNTAQQNPLAALSRKEATARLDAGTPISPQKITDVINNAWQVLEKARGHSGADAKSLGEMYVLLAQAETDAFAALDEASAGKEDYKKGKNKDKSLSGEYKDLQDQARKLLTEVGKTYALRCGEFSKIMLGPNEWPTRFEVDDKGRMNFINTFKSKDDLTPAQRADVYKSRLDEYFGAGGQMSSIAFLDKKSIDKLDVSERYEYVMLTDGRIRFAEIPKKEDGLSPGHSILAEGGVAFKDTRALCAGELWVSREPDGDLSSICISAGSGHFKPYFEALSAINGSLEKMGVDTDKIIHYGGPANARKAARKLLETAGMEKDEAKAMIPLKVPHRRLELRGETA